MCEDDYLVQNAGVTLSFSTKEKTTWTLLPI